MRRTVKQNGLLHRMHPLQRMLISLSVAGAGLLALLQTSLSVLLVSICTWCIFAGVFLLTSWIIIFTSELEFIKKRAKVEDGSRLFIILAVMTAAFASMITVLLLVISKQPADEQTLNVIVSVLCIILSWTMVHTILAFHYAYLYYDDDPKGKAAQAEGLIFPEEKNPDYLDFAYYSFVVGMTFQVSDVQITGKRIRRLTLAHGLIAFMLNTFVVALSINLIAGLSK